MIIFGVIPSALTAVDTILRLRLLKNGKQGVQTVRLDELNNIVTWANICFIFIN